MALFKKGPSPHQTALAMIGAKAGDRVLFAGRPEAPIVVEIARTTGLNGQTLVGAPADARKSLEAAAADAGVLVELVDMAAEALVPAADGTHDAVVLHVDLHPLSEQARASLMSSALDAARPGGRVIVIEGRRRAGFFGSRTPTLPEEAVLALLAGSGALAGRTLGRDAELMYFEARKPR